MIHSRWHPTRCLVTGFADICAVDMTTWQAVATATGTGAVHLGVIYRKGWSPTVCTVTGFANICGVDVAVR